MLIKINQIKLVLMIKNQMNGVKLRNNNGSIKKICIPFYYFISSIQIGLYFSTKNVLCKLALPLWFILIF